METSVFSVLGNLFLTFTFVAHQSAY